MVFLWIIQLSIAPLTVIRNIFKKFKLHIEI